jgi:4-amino-4-deoxy-L-arabinose transferase-like glycosyltransferase
MRARLLAGLLLAATLFFYFAGQRTNPPGFFNDESSISWNALLIARHGTDEHGVHFPLYYEAFGDYKNPVYVYALAGVFEVFPVSDLVARHFSAACGFLTCLALGWLGWRISRSRSVAAMTFLTALCTPMLFEVSRVVFEVAIYPLVTAVFLLVVHAASRREQWGAREIIGISSTLLLLLYAYSIGRLLAPLFALVLARVFYTRERRSAIAAILLVFALLGIVPVAAFNRAHEGALTTRFLNLTYIGDPQSTPIGELGKITKYFALNLDPIGMSFRGDPNVRHHVPGSGGGVLLMTYILVAVSVWLLASARPDRQDCLSSNTKKWWTFVLVGTFLSIVPGALTTDPRHALRLAPYPVFLITLSIPAIDWLKQRHRAAGTVIAAAGAIQAIFFFTIFHRDGASRGPEFEAGAQRVINAALDKGQRPVYLKTLLGYAHANWYAEQRGIHAAFVRGTRTPHGAVVFAEHEDPPAGAVVIDRQGQFVAYINP